MPRCSHIYTSALACCEPAASLTHWGSTELPASKQRFGDSWHACDVPAMAAVAQVPAQPSMTLPLVL